MHEPAADDLIECVNQAGRPVRYPRSAFAFRPAAYAFITRGEDFLAFKLPTGKYFIPGGGVEPGEPMLDALRREVYEEIGGLEIELIEPLGFFEHLYYYDDTQSCWHALSHVYVCRPVDAAWEIPAEAGSAEEGRPEWVKLGSLKESELHPGIMARVLAAFANREK